MRFNRLMLFPLAFVLIIGPIVSHKAVYAERETSSFTR